ncbi:hypothetical protein ACWCQ4_35285, partial [Streptomyces aureus]
MSVARSFRILIALMAVCLFLPLAAHPAHAASWGSPQTVNSWNTINQRWTANNELETYTPSCVWYEGSTLVIKTYKGSDGKYYSGRVESKALYGYGTYSFTASMPNGRGLLPAVWAAYLNRVEDDLVAVAGEFVVVGASFELDVDGRDAFV